MSKVIRSRFGRFAYDAYNPSNLEVFFEFLNCFDEITMPNGKRYRMVDDRLEVQETNEDWREDMSAVADLNRMVKTMTELDWMLVKNTAKVNNLVSFDKLDKITHPDEQ